MRMRAILFAFCMVPLIPVQAATYYVDAERGNDTNNGTAPTTAWKSVDKLNHAKFLPGDTIVFRRGQIWREQLNLQSSGEAQRPITIDAYGEGNAPEITGADLVPAANWTARVNAFPFLRPRAQRTTLTAKRARRTGEPRGASARASIWRGGASWSTPQCPEVLSCLTPNPMPTGIESSILSGGSCSRTVLRRFRRNPFPP